MMAAAPPQPTLLTITPELRREWILNPVRYVEDAIAPPKISNQQRDALEGYRLLLCARLHRKALAESKTTLPLTVDEEVLCRKFGLSIQSGKGVGKNAFSAWVTFHFLDCMRPENIKIMYTAPTEEQLKNNLWSEMHKWLQLSPYLQDRFTYTSEKIYVTEYRGASVYAAWKTCAKSANPTDQKPTMAGKHADYMLLGMDEASGIPDNDFSPIESTMTGPVNFAMITFNPTKATGYAVRSQTTDSRYWLTFQWNVEESDIVEPDHIIRYQEKYGRDSNMYRINILGLPPKSDSQTVIPYEWAESCVDLIFGVDEDDLMVAGLDVAGGGQGSDSTVLVTGQGGMVKKDGIFRTNLLRDREIAEWVLDHWHANGLHSIAVDVNGLGSGVANDLERIGGRYGLDVLRVQVGRSPEKHPDRFERLRDELWWMGREACEHMRVSIPNHEELIGELTTPKYEQYRGAQAKVKVQSKKEMLKSPDTADAWLLWLYCWQKRGKKPRPSLHRGRRARERVVDWRTV